MRYRDIHPIIEKVRPYCLEAAGRLKRFPQWSLKTLSSLMTSVYILGALALLYMVGTIFPQGGDIGEYAKAGGKYVSFVRFFDLLDFFSSPVFLLSALLLLLNLVVCTYKRYGPLFAKRVFPNTFDPTHTFKLTHDYPEALPEVRRVLHEKLGFRLVSKDNEWIVMEKGLSCRWLTWLYHAGIVLCFFGLILSYLFAFEGEMTLKPRTPLIVAPSTTGRLASLYQKTAGPAGFSLYLDDFSTEYIQHPGLDYPKDKLSRLAIGLGWKGPEYSMKNDPMTPKDWRSRLRVIKGGSTVKEKTIEVNDPLRYGGYTFYQVGYEQTLRIRVDFNPIALETKADGDIIVPGLDTPLRFGTVMTGTLYRLDGAVEKILPFTTVKAVLTGPPGGKKTEDLGKLELGGSIIVDGRRVSLADYEESSVLSYRYDPGVAVLWWGGAFVLIAMCLRFYGRSYMVAYAVDESDRIVCLNLHIVSKGLMADTEKLAGRIGYYLTRDDIRPVPLPPL
ncbi:MAG: cytochrome c biogenesis protein ResB [Deltaproteobacteria bacterium]|nr:cytochrome c biogenesis protein ResB [Deltaproteobacteria bacterium]